MADSEVAKYLVKTKLTDKLDDGTIEELLAGGIGPKTLRALNILRDQSHPSLPRAGAAARRRSELPPVPNAEEQAAIIHEVREYALNYTKGLPNFLCTQVTRRKGGRARQPLRRGMQRAVVVQMDTLTLRLSYFEQKEDYKLILLNNSPTTQGYKKRGRRHLHRRVRQHAARDFRAAHPGPLRLGPLGAPARSSS